MKYFGIVRPTKNDVRFEFAQKKNVWFWVISVDWVHSSHKTEKAWFWKLWKFFNIIWQKKYITLDLNVSHGKMANFVSFLLFGLTLVIKLGNFDFKCYRNTLILFDQKPKKKKKILDLIVPCQPVSDLV